MRFFDKAPSRLWAVRAIATGSAVAVMAVIGASPIGAAATTISVTVNSDSNPADETEGVNNPAIHIADFTDSAACTAPGVCNPGSAYTVDINWGDATTNGSPTPVFVSQSGNSATYSITDSHAFTDEWNSNPPATGFPITVRVTGPPASGTGIGHGLIAVKDQLLSAPTGGAFSASAGVPFTNQTLGMFHDSSQMAHRSEPNTSAAEYVISVTWGDGTIGTGDVSIQPGCSSNPPGPTSPSQGCDVTVTGSHTYTAAGVYNVSTLIHDGSSPGPVTIHTVVTVGVASPNACTAANLSANKTSPQATGTAVTFTVSAIGGCPVPQVAFYVYSSNKGTWTLVQPYSTSKTWNLNYADMPTAGTYTVDAWVRNSTGSTAPYESFGLMSWVVGGCNSAVTSNGGAGTVYTTTPAGVDCGAPEYQVWMTGNGRGWFIAQPWSTTATFDASSVTGLSAGTYTIDVWVRQSGTGLASGYYETWGLATYITGGACNLDQPTLIAAPTSPQTDGTMVGFTAAGCGAGASYEYWLFPGAGNMWQMLSAYPNAAGTYSWDTHALGIRPGTYSIVAWAKAAGSTTKTYDSYALYSYTLNGQDWVSTNAAPSSPQPAGTPVVFTATSHGAGTAEYSFWILPIGGSWMNVKPYSSSNTLNWTAGSKNTYAVVVWVRTQNGGTPSGAYETYDAMSYSTS